MRYRILSLLLVGLLAWSLSACNSSQTGRGAQELEGNIAQGGQPDAQGTVTPTLGQDDSALGTLPPLEGEPPEELPLAQLNTLSQLASYRRQIVVRYALPEQPERALYVVTDAANQVSPLDMDEDTLEHTTVAFLEGSQRTERVQFVWIGEGRYWADLERTWQQLDYGPADYIDQSAFVEQTVAGLGYAFLFADNMWPFLDQGQTQFAGVDQVNGMTLWRYVADANQLNGAVQGLDEFTQGQIIAWVDPENAVIIRVEGDLTNPAADGGPAMLTFVMELAQVNQPPDMVPDVLFEPKRRVQFQVGPDGAIILPELGEVAAAGAEVPALNAEDTRPLTVLETYQRHTVLSLAPQGADGPVRRVEILAASATNRDIEADGAMDGAQPQQDQAVDPAGDVLHAVDMYFVQDNQVIGLAQFLGVNDDYWVKDANGWRDAGRDPAEYLEQVAFFADWESVLDANWLLDENVWFLGDVAAATDAEAGLVGVETIDGQAYWRYEYGHAQALAGAGVGSFDQFEDGRVVAWVHPTHQVVTRMFVVAIDENPDVVEWGQTDVFGGAETAQDGDAPRPEQQGLEAIQGVLGQDSIPANVPAGAAVLTIEVNVTSINEPVVITTPDEMMESPLDALTD